MLKVILVSYLSVCVCCAFGQTPGKVSANLQWWFKANAGVNTQVDSSQVDSWVNNGRFTVRTTFRNPISVAGYPQYRVSAINYNPVIRFSSKNLSVFQTTPSNRANMNPMAGSSTVIAVFKSTQATGSFSNVFYYTPNIISTETGVSKRDFALGFVQGSVAVKCDTIDNWAFHTNKQYNGVIPQIAIATKSRQSANRTPAPVHLFMNGAIDQNQAKVNTSYLLNSSDYFFSSVYYGLSIGALTNQQTTLITPSTQFNGDIAELIVYDRVLNSSEINLVNSYLAIKYGITLDQASGNNYLSSDNKLIWHSTGFTAYNKNIAGIGQDDSSGLYQPQSQSVNPGSLLVVSEPNSLDNMDFLMWSENGLPLIKDTLDIPQGLRSRTKKAWQIQKTGEVGTVRLTIDISGLQSAITPENIRLLIDDNGIFKTGIQTILTPSSVKNNIVTFENVAFDNINAKFFSIAELYVKSSIIVYQLISPNNDGLNDGLMVENIEEYPDNELSIYNHEGNLIYNKKSFQNGEWDCGKVIDGNYYYLLNIDGQKLSGHLVIKR